MAVLGSTSGTDLQAVIEAVESGKLKVNISFVLSNKKDAFILERARKHKITDIFVDKKGRDDFDREVDKLLVENNVELVVLIGYMRFLSDWFVDKWRNKVINIHPSLLPAFAGGMDKNVHKEILEHGCKVSGATLMFVDEGADTGPIILQKAVEIDENETVDSLKDKVQAIEKELIIEGINLFKDRRLEVKGRVVHIK